MHNLGTLETKKTVQSVPKLSPLAPASPSLICKLHSLIHLAVCFTTGPNRLPKPALHTLPSTTSSFRCDYPLLFLTSSSNILRLLPRLPVTSIPPFIFPSIKCCRRQFLRKMLPIQLTFRLLISCRTAFFKLWSADHKWSSGSALVVLGFRPCGPLTDIL
jgi:hypothetical protein